MFDNNTYCKDAQVILIYVPSHNKRGRKLGGKNQETNLVVALRENLLEDIKISEI